MIYVPTDDVNLMNLWDILLGTTLLLCTLIGLPGNIYALSYFWCTRRRDLAILLYLIVSTVDIFTTFLHLPVMLSLFDGRSAGLFSDYTACVIWNILFDFVQKISLFLVLLLSVSRTASIRFPFVKVSKKKVLGAFLCYIALFVFHKLLVAFHGISINFVNDGPYCYSLFSNSTSWAIADRLIVCAQVGIPSFVTFFSFIISTSHLSSKEVTQVHSPAAAASKRANMTVAIFTGVFLICNLPYCVVKVLEITNYVLTKSAFEEGYPGLFFKSEFMYWYSWTLSHIVFTVLNATVNPVVYFFRFRKFRSWVVKSAAKSTVGISDLL